MSDYCGDCKYLMKNVAGFYQCKVACLSIRKDYVLNQLYKEALKPTQCINNKWYEQQEKKVTTEEMIKVMQGYADGKQIEQAYCATKNKEWYDSTMPIWNWYQYDYRIKPEPKYRPLKPEELVELKGKWLKAKNNSTISLVTDLVEHSGVVIKGTYRSLHELFNYWTYEDGTPVGKLEE